MTSYNQFICLITHTHLLKKLKENELTQGQKKACHSAHTMKLELTPPKKKKVRKKVNMKGNINS